MALLPVEVAFRLGSVLGLLCYALLPPYRRLAQANLQLAFEGEKDAAECRRMARRHFARLGGNLLSSLKIATLPKEEILKRVEWEEPEEFVRAGREKRGLVLVISHMGNWEILAQVLPLLFPGKGGTIYQRLGNSYIDADIRQARARQGLALFERKEGFQKAITLLREGGGVGILIDQHAGDKGLWCPLFGRLASTTPLAATMALRTDALLLPAGVCTLGPGRWRVSFGTPIPTQGQGAEALTASVNEALEGLIRTSPEDWFWVHNRWKTPKPNFLLSGYKRGVVLPEGFAPEKLKPFRIVIRSSNWLGDAVMTLPTVQAIKRGRPDAEVTVLVKEKLAGFWSRVPEVDSVLPITAKDTVFSVARKLRAGRFEVGVILPNSIRTGLEMWLAGIPRRVGHPGAGRKRLLNQPLPPPKKKPKQPLPARHQVFHYLALARFMGAEVPEEADPAAFFSPAPLRTSPPPAGARRRIGLCPGAEYGPAKRWMPGRFAETMKLVDVAGEQPTEWVLFGVKGDAPLGEEIVKLYGSEVTNRIGQTTLGELMDELATCERLLTNDTGTMHLATALGVPVVAVFGSTEPRLTGPLGPGHTVLRHQVECSPCFQRECPLDFRCMHAVTAEEAAAALRVRQL